MECSGAAASVAAVCIILPDVVGDLDASTRRVRTGWLAITVVCGGQRMHLYERGLCVHVQHRQGVCVLDVCDGPSSPRYIASRSGPSSPRYIASRHEASREKTRRCMIFDAMQSF